MDPRQLIDLARNLALGRVGSHRGRPRQTHLRRAVSASYYAMFHALAVTGATSLVSANPAGREQETWVHVYRSLEHGQAKNQFMNKAAMGRFPEAIRQFGQLFVRLQSQRQAADYNPLARFERLQVRQLIEETAGVIEMFTTAPRADLRALALYVLLRPRRE